MATFAKLHTAILAYCITLLVSAPFVTAKDSSRPNIVLITINVFRVDHLSIYGYDRVTTPAIDQLSEEALIFTKAYAQAGYTFPNMMSILTSLYPQSHQVLDIMKDQLSAKIQTLPEILSRHGYKTGWFADLHEPHLALEAGYGRGFDDKTRIGLQLEGHESIHQWIKKNRSDNFFIAINTRHTHTPYLPLAPFREHFSAGYGIFPRSDEAYHRQFYQSVITRLKEKDRSLSAIFPPELQIAHPEIFDGQYTPWKIVGLEDLLPPEQRYKIGQLEIDFYNDLINLASKESPEQLIALYDSCILGTDQLIVEPIIRTLKEEGLYDNTLIIVTADHGESHGEHGIYGHGPFNYEQLIHVPLIIKPAKPIQPGYVTTPVMSIDLTPTILESIGISPPFHIQGTSIYQLLDGAPAREYLFGENQESAYLIAGKWKIILDRTALDKTFAEDHLLFDLDNDPGELIDLKKIHTTIYHELRNVVINHLNTVPVYRDTNHHFSDSLDQKTIDRIKKTGYW